MALKKLQIMVEKEGAVLTFEQNSDTNFSALFNPDKLVFNKSVNWQKQDAAQRDVPELQFTNAEPRTLTGGVRDRDRRRQAHAEVDDGRQDEQEERQDECELDQ